MNLERAVSPKSDSDEFDSLDLEEVGEKSLWILRGEGKEQSLRSLRVSRSLRAKELEALRRENEDLKKQAGSREEREAELRQREKQIASLTQQLEEAKTAAKSETTDLRQKLAKKDDELRALRDGNATLQKELSGLKERLQVKNTEVKDLSQRASTLGEKRDQHAREVTELKEQLQRMQQTKSGDDKSKKAEIDRLTAEVSELTIQLQSKSAHVKELNQQASAHGGEKDQLAKEVEKLRGELLEVQQTKNNGEKTKQAEIDQLTEHLDDLRGQLQIKNRQVKELQQLVESRGEDKKRLMSEKDQLQAQLVKMQQASTSMMGNNEANVAKVHQLTKQLSTQAKENEQKTREIEQLKQDLACAQENIAELMGASGGVGPGPGGRARPTDRKATTPPTEVRAGGAGHTCPVCDKTLRVSQAEFERHVNSHFN